MHGQKGHSKQIGGLKGNAVPSAHNGNKAKTKGHAKVTQNRVHDPKRTTTTSAAEDVHEWLRIAQRLEQRAFEETNPELLRVVQRFVTGLLQICQLFGAFQSSPGQRIDGERGVAKQLGISRNAVYLRVTLAGLTPEDFREPKIDLPRLVLASKVTGPLLAELKEKELD
jgi:hypothetical protein